MECLELGGRDLETTEVGLLCSFADASIFRIPKDGQESLDENYVGFDHAYSAGT